MMTCTKCGTRHDTDEQIASCKKAERSTKILTWVVFATIAITILGIDIGWHVYAYDDWRCAFMHCVKVVGKGP